MRRLFLLTVLLALTAAPTAEAGGLLRFVSAAADSVALADGTGTARIRSVDGAIVGNVARGRVTFVEVGRSSRIRLCGRRPGADGTVTCYGRGIRFSALLGAWRVRIIGTGINASARVRGSMTLAPTPAGRASGTYSIEGVRSRWPRTERTFALG